MALLKLPALSTVNYTFGSTKLVIVGNTFTATALDASDSFNDASLDTSVWGTATANGGSITETSFLTINSDTTSKAAILYYKTPLPQSTSTRWKVRAKVNITDDSTNVFKQPLAVFNSSIPPAPDVSANNSSRIVLRHQILTTAGGGGEAGDITHTVRMNNSSFQHASYGDFITDALISRKFQKAETIGTDIFLDIENDTTNIKFSVLDSTEKVNYITSQRTIAANAGVGSEILPQVDNWYACLGDFYSNLVTLTMAVKSLKVWTVYPTGAPEIEMSTSVSVGAAISEVPLSDDSSGANANVKFQYNTGGGYNGSWLAMSCVSTLVGTSPATLRLKFQFNSDGDDRPVLTFDEQGVIGHSVSAGSGGVSKARLVNDGGM